MAEIHHGFARRVRRIDVKHARLERGYVGRVRGDGLIEFKPRRRMPAIPWRGLLYLMLGFAFFKAVVIAHLGTVTYEERLARLAAGHVLEQAGAYIMQPDPLSATLAGYLAPVLR